jgi:NitT/TauT family transport system substrate-binding protein
MIPLKGPETALKALVSVDDKLAGAKLDVGAIFTNEFVKKANAKYPKG